MHAGKPYGLHVVGQDLTDKDQSFISATALRFANLKKIRNIETLKLVYELPDGGSFIIQDAGGNFRVIAHKPLYKEPVITFDGRASTKIPMLFSGAVASYGLIKEGSGLRLKLTKQTSKRLVLYGKQEGPTDVELLRFACKYGPRFQEFMPERPVAGLNYTQYMKQRPTWYSGAMSEVMQIVGGYGKQKIEDLPDDPIERAVFELPQKRQEAIAEQLKSIRLPCYTGLPNKDGQFQYDYKFFQTDLVSFDVNNKPWLIRISSAGVWAMPLPVVPATTTEVFRAYIEEVGDDEILAILDRFGGMPSGEGMPTSSSAFYAWVRAGVIIKVCDTKEFYQNLGYSSAMGWTSNSNGTEVANTCYDLDYTTGKITARAYKIKLELGAADNIGWVTSRTSSSIGDVLSINKYLQFIYELITENTPTNIAIKYKINKTPLSDIQARAMGSYNESEVDYWNNLELPPIAVHKGSLTKIDEGVYFRSAGVKVPEPMLGGCISIPAPLPIVSDRTGKKDTTVLIYYIEDSIKTVKLFVDDRIQTKKIETNFEDYMYSGQWYKRELIGDAYIVGDVYTSDIDDRFIAAPTEIETNIAGVDLGYGGAILQMDFYFWRTGNLSRYKYYTTETTTRTLYSRSMALATAIPYLCRNMLIYAKTDRSEKETTVKELKLGQILDPYTYRIWSDNESMLMFGGLEVQNGTPYPVDGKPVYAEIKEYRPNEANAWADSGDWVGSLPADIAPLLYDYSKVIWAFRAAPPPPPVNEYKRTSETKSNEEKELKCQLYERVDKVRKGYHSSLYYDSLPDEYMNTLDIDACKVLFGSKRYANISEVTETGNRKQWGESLLVDNKSAHHFIGVINE